MLVFISWSGQRSKYVAQALEKWLVQVIQAVEPWISTDIEKGSRWSEAISSRLEESKAGIICLTPENLTSPWILFEAGTLSKSRSAHVCTFLIGIRHVDIKEPLSQFQHTTSEKEDVRQLVQTINRLVRESGERYLPDAVLDELFETFWPRLKTAIAEADTLPEASGEKLRSDREVLEEILELLRRQEGRQSRFQHEAETKLLKDVFASYLHQGEANPILFPLTPKKDDPSSAYYKQFFEETLRERRERLASEKGEKIKLPEDEGES